MPSLNLPLPMPSMLAGLMPVAANPVARVDAAPGESFDAVIASLGDGLMLDAPPSPLPGGTALPPERPHFAGAPQPLPEIEVEQVMVGAAAILPVPTAAAPATAPVLTAAPEPAAPAAVAVTPAEPVPVAAPSPAPQIQAADRAAPPVAATMLQGASPLAVARATPRLLTPPEPGPALPQPIVSNAPEPLSKEEQPDPEPLTAAMPVGESPDIVFPVEAPAEPVPPVTPVEVMPPAPVVPITAPPLAPVTSNGPAPVETPIGPPKAAREPATGRRVALPDISIPFVPLRFGTVTGASQTPVPAAAPQPALAEAAAAVPSQVTPQATPPAATPPSFALPPEVARQVADMVRASNGGDPLPAEAPAVPVPTGSAPAAPVAQVAAPAPTQPSFVPAGPPSIDTSRAEWMQAMIERIAEMPQANGKREAQIRLLPDALGAVEVKIEQRQDRLHVTLNADNAHARQLLSEAAPRLHELAEARGLRFAQTDVGGGQQHDRRPAPDHSRTPHAPHPAPAGAEVSDQPTGDLIA